MANIGKNIRKFRTELGLTQEGLAIKAEVKYTTLTKIEAGVVKNPRIDIVVKIAQALRVDIKSLL